MIKQEDVYQIGRLGKPHGVRGEITFLFDDDVFDRVEAEYLILQLDGILVPFFLEGYRFRGDTSAILKFCDIDTQEEASGLTGSPVFFPRNHHADDEETLSKAELIGFRIVDSHSEQEIGVISAIDDSTPNILFNVTAEDGKTLLIPASPDLIEAFSRETRELKMNLPEGILNL
ncbi:MAG: ribosome maturation factor RimM [Prevotella sp.]|nr:ribosome maturation factor RimM [Prevotella sp.]MDY4038168.1 ribosome maturation factor RimM [Prevotella sp.]